ncbi:MAG: ROK family protein [Planktomarina sp.]
MTKSLNMVIDVGGTNTRIAVAENTLVRVQTIMRYRNDDFPSLQSVIKRFRKETSVDTYAQVCACIAGPVRSGKGSLTNRNWSIDEAELAVAAGAVNGEVINDLQAQGHALESLGPDSLTQVVQGNEAPENATRLVVGVGTGFNAAVVVPTFAGKSVPPSEAGHANLPIRNEDQLSLCQFVETAHGFPAIEDVVSGRGLENVYAWRSHVVGSTERLSSTDIMAGVADGSNMRAVEAADLFVSMLGTVCGNLSLVHLPFGGVYLVGGMARAFAPYLRDMGFTEAFRDKGRFSGFMTNFSVYIVEDDYAALAGCASHLAALGYDDK